MKKKLLLQLFADGEGDGGTPQGGQEGNPDGDPDGTGTGAKTEPISFDDFLGMKGNQAEFDRRVNKAIATAVANAQKKWETITSNKVSEAEKLAQMTSEEKERYRADKAEKELEELKKKMALGDMAKTARKMLADEEVSVPDEIIFSLVSDDAEKTKESVEAFTKAFKDAVQEALKKALKSGTPRTGGSSGGITIEDIKKVKDPAERRRLIAENMDLFQ